MNWFDIAQEQLPQVREGNTQAAVTRVAEVLRTLPPSPFHQILDLDFTNQPLDVAAHFDRFRILEFGFPSGF